MAVVNHEPSRLELNAIECIENNNYYEAHQRYRTAYYRFMKKNDFPSALNLLYSGALRLFEVNEYQSGIDLSDLYVQVLLQSHTAYSEAVLEQLRTLLNEYYARAPLDSKDENIKGYRNKFVTDAVKWSQTCATKNREKKRGLSTVHDELAKVFWENKDYEAARSHFLVAEDPEVFADFLIDYHRNLCDEDEVDLVIVLAVLQLLCLHRVKTAETLFTYFTERHPSISHSHGSLPYKNPLLNFAYFLMQLCPKRNVSQYAALVEKYAEHLMRDGAYRSYLDRVGQLFFGIAPPQNATGGLFGNLFKGLIGDKKEEEENFSDSDMDVPMEQDGDEDGYETADDEPGAATSSSQSSAAATSKTPVPRMDQMDDLD